MWSLYESEKDGEEKKGENKFLTPLLSFRLFVSKEEISYSFCSISPLV